MKINSPILGQIEIEEKNLITFESGIPGFEDQTQFALIPMDDNSPFFYLQAIRNPELCLILTDPFSFFSDYKVKLDDEHLEKLEVKKDETPIIAVYCILTIPEDFKKSTANLLAPIAINHKTKKGLQFVSEKSEYTTKHYIFNQTKDQPQKAAVNEGP
ncbi:hypothetical protein SYNTR_1837 [Candidatus Syntrophocurvum alkaliphilum]|uniref:Flagellar assembly factor FliW n=1 Tax=Candidatus Syntrophocurvum alkaliphilum TaxID=2293317 RepID=A0A6I6DMC9_9FIRM|nr:flagellar assembly protein FliW [Candidatus Syntrophocurvum alkaliphilum]QGU00431.1 hypothetical protein SYNTR_1837 [Candidatus Syntrophocurvum alkaliphilum]